MSHSSGYSTTHWRARIRALAKSLALALALCFAQEAKAQDDTWDGGDADDNNWTSGDNWADDTAPAGNNGEDLLFTGTVRPGPVNDFTAGTTFDSIELDTTVTFTLTGNAIAITGAGIDNTAGTNVFDIPLVLTTASAVNSDAGLITVGGTIDNGGNLLTVSGAGNSTLNGVISGAGGLTKTGAGLATLGGANSFGGDVTINGGTLSIADVANGGANSNLGAGTSSIAINAATLQFTGATDSTDRGVDLTGNGTLDVNTAGTVLTVGTISGTGNLVKVGAGTLATTGANTYDGSTTLNAGGISIANSGGLGDNVATNVLNFAASSTLIFADTDANAATTNGIDLSTRAVNITGASVATLQADAGVNGTIGGAISDDTDQGAITKTGVGTVTLTGTNTHGGANTIEKGTLAISNANNLGNNAQGVSFTDTVADATADDTLQFTTGIAGFDRAINFGVDGVLRTTNAADEVVLATATTGTGAMIKEGAGTLTLAAVDHGYGNLVIADGTVVVNSLVGLGTTNAVLFNETAVATDAANSADNVFRLGTQFDLTGTTFDVAAGQVAVLDTNTFDTNLTGALTTGDAAATLNRIGTGTMTLSAASAGFTGTFQNSTGTALFNANTLGSATTGAGTFENVLGATLIGSGTAGTLNNSGTLAPGVVGAPIGTMTAFNFNQAAGSNFIVDLNADGTRDQVVANGSVAVNGTLTLQGDLSNQGSYFGQTFNIVTADADNDNTGDITDGTFDSVTSNFTFLAPTVTVVNGGGNGPEFIQVAFNSFAVDLNTLAANPNQAAVAQAIQNIFTTGQASSEFSTIFNQFFVASPAEQQNFLQQLAGEVGTANMTAALQANSSFTALALSQLASSSFSADSGDGRSDDEDEELSSAPTMARFGMSTASGFGAMPGFGSSMVSGMPGGDDAVLEDRDSVWVLGTGFWGDIDPTAVNQGFEYDGSGFVLGYTFGDEDRNNWKWGIHGGFNESDIDTVGALDSSDVDSWNVGLHGAYFEDGDYVNVVTGYNKNEFDTTRFFNIGTFAATSRAQFDADEFFAYAEIGHIYDLGDDSEDEEVSAAPGRTTASGLMLGAMDAPHGKGAHKDHKRVDHKVVEPAEEPVQEPVQVEEEKEMVEKYGGEGWHAAPQLALQYRSYEQDAYTSTGAGALDQTVGPVELDMFQTGLGARFFHTSRTDEGGWIVPEVMVRWAHEFGDIDRTIRANFVGTNEVFAINGIRPDRDSLQLRAGVAAYTARDWNFDVSYNGEFSDNIENHAGVAKATWFFD